MWGRATGLHVICSVNKLIQRSMYAVLRLSDLLNSRIKPRAITKPPGTSIMRKVTMRPNGFIIILSKPVSVFYSFALFV